jgi:hypothetical protein
LPKSNFGVNGKSMVPAGATSGLSSEGDGLVAASTGTDENPPRVCALKKTRLAIKNQARPTRFFAACFFPAATLTASEKEDPRPLIDFVFINVPPYLQLRCASHSEHGAGCQHQRK